VRLGRLGAVDRGHVVAVAGELLLERAAPPGLGVSDERAHCLLDLGDLQPLGDGR